MRLKKRDYSRRLPGVIAFGSLELVMGKGLRREAGIRGHYLRPSPPGRGGVETRAVSRREGPVPCGTESRRGQLWKKEASE